MKNKRLSPAFSMLELIFVIVILGIVASIGSELIVKVYESYIVQRAEHRATLKTELAATQIANRLASAIPGTVYRIRNTNAYEPIDANFPGTDGDDYKGIKWVGADTDSFTATATPGWSGFIDVDDSANTKHLLSTPGSDLTNTTAAIINNLSSSSPEIKIYFPYDLTEYNATIAGTIISPTGAGASHVVEHYKLAWSSYALVVESGDLYLYYDFPATPASAFTGQTKSLLMKNISTFKFQGAGRTIRFKICKEERISDDINVTACKEKAVF